MRGIWALVLLSTAAQAQPSEPPPADVPPAEHVEPTPALRAFQEGRELVEAGRFDEACAKFAISLKEDPDAPGTLLNLGLCNEKLGKTATALAWYRKAQFRSAETKMTDYEEAAKQQTIVLAAKVATLRIEAPPGAHVIIDGRQIPDVELGRIEVDAGNHAIEAGSQRREITIHDGDKQAVDMRPPPAKRFVTIDPGVTQRRYAYLAAGAGVAFYAASATLSLIGKSKYDATDHPETYLRWQNIVRYGGTSLFVVGSAAIAGGVYLYLKAPRPERVEQVAPIVTRDQLGVAVVGAF